VKRYTASDLAGWSPCWERSRREPIARRQPSWSVMEVLDLEVVPAADRVWLACHMLPWAQAVLIAADCACRALIHDRAAGREPDPRSWEAVRVARDAGLGLATMDRAQEAARAARSAARSAGSSAAWSAWWAASAASAASAAWAASWAAWTARAAARAAEAESQTQVRRIRELVQSGIGVPS